jgi:hypothetical protein
MPNISNRFFESRFMGDTSLANPTQTTLPSPALIPAIPTILRVGISLHLAPGGLVLIAVRVADDTFAESSVASAPNTADIAALPAVVVVGVKVSTYVAAKVDIIRARIVVFPAPAPAKLNDNSDQQAHFRP